MLEAKETGQREVLTITSPKFKYEISKIPSARSLKSARTCLRRVKGQTHRTIKTGRNVRK